MTDLGDAWVVIASLPAPSPPVPRKPADSSVDFGSLWHAVVRGLWAGVTASPWTAAAVTAVAMFLVVRLVHSLAHPPDNRDPVRRFTREDKNELLRRAGGRCEHHGWIGGRCAATAGLEADHVHPHSRGGWTNISNGQVLCKRHNRSKRATIPFDWQLKRIAKRRANYYPPGVPGLIVRRFGENIVTTRRSSCGRRAWRCRRRWARCRSGCA